MMWICIWEVSNRPYTPSVPVGNHLSEESTNTMSSQNGLVGLAPEPELTMATETRREPETRVAAPRLVSVQSFDRSPCNCNSTTARGFSVLFIAANVSRIGATLKFVNFMKRW